jgi:hypothetical protein
LTKNKNCFVRKTHFSIFCHKKEEKRRKEKKRQIDKQTKEEKKEREDT